MGRTTPTMYEVCSSGAVMIYYTTTGKEETEEGIQPKFAFQIQHGWKPLLFSTASCFARITCQSSVPIVIPKSVNLVVKGKNVKLYLPLSCKVKNEDGSRVTEQQNQDERLPLLGVVSIYAANLKKFQERVEAWISDDVTAYCEGGQEVLCAKGSEVIIYRGDLEKDKLMKEIEEEEEKKKKEEEEKNKNGEKSKKEESSKKEEKSKKSEASQKEKSQKKSSK